MVSRARGFKQVATMVAVSAVLVVVAGCGGDSNGADSGSSGGKPELSFATLLYGPTDDGGFNLANTAPQEALKSEFGDKVEVKYTDNVPFAEEAAQIAQRQIDQGANVLVDSVGLGDIINKVCKANPTVKCILYGAAGKVPANAQGVWTRFWLKEYGAGQLAGRLTKSNTVGFVSPYDVPFVKAIVNSFAMGCRNTNPSCQVRVINVNEYFNPPKSSQAANTLVDAGADVLRGAIDDPSYCAVAEKRKVWAIPEFWDGSPQCPTQIATSTVWNFSDYMAQQARKMLDGTWKPTGALELIPADQVFTLGPWGPKVPAEVQKQTEDSFSALTSGKVNPFIGPISDSRGKVRVQKGQELDVPFFFSEWKWNVEGVVAK